MNYNSTILAIDLVKNTYNLIDPFEIQSKIEEDLNMEIHINCIMNHLKIKNYENNIKIKTC